MTGRYRPYPAYKPSQAEWLVSIPDGWDSCTLKWLAKLYTGGTPSKAVEEFWDDGTIPWLNSGAVNQATITEPSTYISESALRNSSAKWIPKNSLVLALAGQGKTKGMVAFTTIETTCNQSMAAIVFRPLYQPKFFYWWLTSNYQRIRNTAGGDLRDGLNLELLGNINSPLPSTQEQTQIAAFLDYETAKIDALIGKQQRLIALLEEKRQAVISHAVTKGLNPDAPLHPSGIDWLGDVPEHWDLKRLRNIGSCQNGINIGAEFFGSGSPFISYGDVYKNAVLPTSVSGLVRSSSSDKESYSAKRGDVFFTRTSETIDEIGFASTCLEGVDDATFAGFLIRFRPVEDGLVAEFSCFYFRMNLLRFFFVKEMNLITRASLSQDLLKRLPVLLPPKSEQATIARHLEEKHRVFERLADNAQSAITLLKERRTALISAAVTGKIDVRDWRPPKPASNHHAPEEHGT